MENEDVVTIQLETEEVETEEVVKPKISKKIVAGIGAAVVGTAALLFGAAKILGGRNYDSDEEADIIEMDEDDIEVVGV